MNNRSHLFALSCVAKSLSSLRPKLSPPNIVTSSRLVSWSSYREYPGRLPRLDREVESSALTNKQQNIKMVRNIMPSRVNSHLLYIPNLIQLTNFGMHRLPLLRALIGLSATTRTASSNGPAARSASGSPRSPAQGSRPRRAGTTCTSVTLVRGYVGLFTALTFCEELVC